MPQLADITVVVPTCNEARNIPGFLGSLPAEVELVVVDNSSDETREIVAATRPERTQIIRYPGSLTEARQCGALCATTPWLLFTDADVVFAADYFTRADRAGSFDVLYGPKFSTDEYRRFYQWFARGQRAMHALGLPSASGSNLLVSARAFSSVGGFDVGLPCNEDSELVWRLHARGFGCVFAADLVVWATDHRRLRRGVWLKTAHTLARCALLRSGWMPRRWRNHDWGYWAKDAPSA